MARRNPGPATEADLRIHALRTRALRADDWPVIEALFGANRACGGCWCMWWRVPMGGKAWDAAEGEPNRRAFKHLVEPGQASGLLAFVGDEVAGWCAIGPRADFPRTERSKALLRDWTRHTWALNCFYLPPRWRNLGVASALVEAAVAFARKLGAEEIAAYPQAVDSGKHQAAAFAWTGVPSLFVAQGFKPVHAGGRGRQLYLRRPA